MSSDISIKVENLSKCYQIYDQPRDRLKQFVVPRLQRAIGQPSRQYFREFWALKEVSFEVKRGETVGIIGRNGAGKSTLLQILCGTLSPTQGNVEIKGRVAALLELGSGFNPEFTGRENVYMNASVLGLSNEEIDARLDEIVTFADIGDFLDQPVKTYSSGMYIRLAFAVVVHVDADILIVDEALSVGDMYFQAKCMAHMKKLMDSGVTVLFVSHDTSSVKALCSRAVYLERGKVVASGSTDEVVEAYYGESVKSRQSIPLPKDLLIPDIGTIFDEASFSDQTEFSNRANFQRLQNGMAQFLNVLLLDEYGHKMASVNFGENIRLRMIITFNVDLPLVGLGYHIRDRNGFDVIYSDTGIEQCHLKNLSAGEVIVVDWDFKAHLCEGDYSVATVLSVPLDLSISKAEICDWVPLAASLKVTRGNYLPVHAAVYWPNKVYQHRIGSSMTASSRVISGAAQ